MPIPNAHSAFVPPEKLTDYLLNEQHPVGGSKAKWFISLGYDPANPVALELELLSKVRSSDKYTEFATAFGKKYVVSGTISTPKGQCANLITVWIVERPNTEPRFVTAVPGDK